MQTPEAQDTPNVTVKIAKVFSLMAERVKPRRRLSVSRSIDEFFKDIGDMPNAFSID